MRDRWYGDHRDLIKWGGLLEIARLHKSQHILQVAYYRKCLWERIEVGDKLVDIAPDVMRHFRNVSQIEKLGGEVSIGVVSESFDDRGKYLQIVLSAVKAIGKSPRIVFFDPDTGLEPLSEKSGPTHTLESELAEIWKSLSQGDVLALYQHQTNRAGKPWVEEKQSQFERVLHVSSKIVRAAEPRSKDFAALPRDVVIFYAVRP